MKRYIKSLITVGLFSLAFVNTSCLDEVEPTDRATVDQIGASSKATVGLLNAMPQYLNDADDDNHFDFGYGCMIHMRDVLTGDMFITASGYDWFSPWAECVSLSKNQARASYIYRYYYKQIQTANNMISAINPEGASDEALGYLGVGYAYRAMAYLDVARQYEYLPTDVTTATNSDGNNVSGLTAPIVTEKTTEEEARNNPRVTRQAMFEFILSDLDKAEEYIPHFEEDAKAKDYARTFPHLDCVYGLKARLYMWVEDYPKAREYARKAINETYITPMTEDACTNSKTGFNDITKWMWGAQQTSEDGSVKTGIINWTSWMSNETTFGYASAGPYVMISKALYDRMNDSDFRKNMYKAPKTSSLYGKQNFLISSAAEDYPDYASIKFRPNAGETEDYKIGAASAYPLMRVEEMYFIEAEAAAHQNANDGLQLLNTFMKKYRDPKYSCNLSAQVEIIDEIVAQKRAELFGEGQSYFDYKRLNMGVTRVYKDSNISDENARINTTVRPAWMNFVISQAEEDNNKGVVGYNNPDPSGLYTPIPVEE